jgi:hypothetical protein
MRANCGRLPQKSSVQVVHTFAVMARLTGLVEPSVRDRGVGGSNPLAPTNKSRKKPNGPGDGAILLYGPSFQDVPGSDKTSGESSRQLPSLLPSVAGKLSVTMWQHVRRAVDGPSTSSSAMTSRACAAR